MLLNSNVTNAITILHALQATDMQVLPVTIIAEKNNLSPVYLQQISCKLRKAGIIGTRRGPNGGYFLKRTDVTLLDLVKLFQMKRAKYLEVQGQVGAKLEAAMAAIEVV